MGGKLFLYHKIVGEHGKYLQGHIFRTIRKSNELVEWKHKIRLLSPDIPKDWYPCGLLRLQHGTNHEYGASTPQYEQFCLIPSQQ
jgi:hypothetical protein